MQLPLQITFRGMGPSPAVEDRVREMAGRLERYRGRITSCRVVIDAPHRHHQHGKLYQVSIDVTFPGGEIAVKQNRRFDHAHEDVYVAMRDAFKALQRRLQDDTRVRRGQVKSHAEPYLGTVVKLFREEGYGFADTPDGEVYFNKGAVVGEAFDTLAIGTKVRMVLAVNESAQGLQASTVTPHAHQVP